MARSVIDELIVTLGLDASQFTEGQKKAAASMVQTRNVVTSSISEMGSSITGFIGKLSAFVLGFEGLRGVINLVKETAYQFKQLGITSELLGTSVRNTRIAQEFSQLAGAGPDALQNWVQAGRMQLSAVTMGSIPKWLLPGMIGLNPTTAFQGSPEEVFARWQSAATRAGPQLMRQMPGASTPAMATQQFLQMAGMDPALAAEATNRKHMQDDLNRSMRDNKNVTDAMASAGRQAVQSLISLRTQIENAATAGFGPLATATGLLQTAFSSLLGVLNDILNSPLVKWLQSTAKAEAPKAVKGALAVGSWVENYTRKLYGGLGEAWADITNMAHGNLMSDVLSGNKGAPYGLPSYAPSPDALMHAMPAIRFPQTTSSLIGPGGQSSTQNSFAIGSINVNTAATDAAGIAADMRSAVARKFAVTQADSGMVA